jgi:hypothetical protein
MESENWVYHRLALRCDVPCTNGIAPIRILDKTRTQRIQSRANLVPRCQAHSDDSSEGRYRSRMCSFCAKHFLNEQSTFHHQSETSKRVARKKSGRAFRVQIRVYPTSLLRALLILLPVEHGDKISGMATLRVCTAKAILSFVASGILSLKP